MPIVRLRGPEAYQHVICRTPEPRDANEHPPVDLADERFFQKDRKALSVALHCVHYNFADTHKTCRISPAMAAAIEDKLWQVADIVAMIELGRETKPTHYPKIILLVKVFKSIYLHGSPRMN